MLEKVLDCRLDWDFIGNKFGTIVPLFTSKCLFLSFVEKPLEKRLFAS
jgi:hypothetical protein